MVLLFYAFSTDPFLCSISLSFLTENIFQSMINPEIRRLRYSAVYVTISDCLTDSGEANA